jgi:toxin FitB
MPWFGDRVLSVNLAIAERWGDLSAELRATGRPRPVVDAILAATSFKHDLVFVTRNVRDFQDLAGTILNPWEEV